MAPLAGSLNVTALLLFGTLNALFSKVVYQLEAPDCEGQLRSFQKPWAQTALMFLAMTACLPVAYVLEHRQRVQAQQQLEPHGRGKGAGQSSDAEQPLLEPERGSSPEQHVTASASASSSGGWREAAWLSVPTLFDLVATTLMNVGLLYVTASVFQMLRGAEMVFAALFAVLLLHRHLNKWHYGGIALCVAGITLVGCATLLTDEDSDSAGGGVEAYAAPTTGDLLSLHAVSSQPPSHTYTSAGVQGTGSSLWLPTQLAWQWGRRLAGAAAGRLQQVAEGGGSTQVDPKLAALGMGLILASQAIQAGQITLEDHFMADMGMHPLKVVGYEGLMGSLLTLGVALPLLQVTPGDEGSGFHEDTRATLCMLAGSRPLALIQVASVVAMLMYNIAGMLVTDELGASARTVLETTRTLFVWLGGLGLFYSPIGHHQLGEPWASYSWVQAGGFAILVAGALVYDKGSRKEAAEAERSGVPLKPSKWAVLKATLPLWTGHVVGPAGRWRAAARTVMAVHRMQGALG